MQATQNTTVDMTGTPATVLRSAALYLIRHGWIQGSYYDATTGVFTPPACTVGAIGMVCYGGPVDAPAQMFDKPGFDEFEFAMLHLDRYLIDEFDADAYGFNDTKGRNLAEIVAALRAAANVWESERHAPRCPTCDQVMSESSFLESPAVDFVAGAESRVTRVYYCSDFTCEGIARVEITDPDERARLFQRAVDGKLSLTTLSQHCDRQMVRDGDPTIDFLPGGEARVSLPYLCTWCGASPDIEVTDPDDRDRIVLSWASAASDGGAA